MLLILAPQWSFIRILVYHHWRVLQQSGWLIIHAICISSLTLLTLTSLTVCVTRDPGPVNIHRNEPTGNDVNLGLAEALMSGAEDEYIMTPGKWCRKCWAPKPERAHHCSVCGRCVLKMDHHCPWLGSSCIVRALSATKVLRLTSYTGTQNVSFLLAFPYLRNTTCDLHGYCGGPRYNMLLQQPIRSGE